MKKSFVYHATFLAVSGLSLLMLLVQTTAAEQAAVTTYYPAPDGQYKDLSSTNQTTLATGGTATAQVGIGTTMPASKAVLDIVSTSKGVLLPRVTTAQRVGIAPGAQENGLLVYDTDLKAFQYYDITTSSWKPMGSGGGASPFWEQIGAFSDIRNTNTGYVGIGTPSGVNPPAKLTVQDGAILDTGTSEGTPASGPGTRLMWIPAKAAFRAGSVTGSQWDDANIGSGSFATGHDTIASGTDSVAMGNQSAASGTTAVALGYQVTASGNESVAIGGPHVIASGGPSYAIGNNISATNTYSFVIGEGLPGSPLVNNTANSLMIGLNSDTPTLFVGPNVDGAGYVGIRTTNPTTRLEVNGNIMTSCGLFSSSDARLKTDILPLTHTLDKLRRVQGVSFNWNSVAREKWSLKQPSRQIGVVAQELEKVYPELVSKNGEYQSVDYGRMSAVLIQALNELQKKNSALQTRLESLENKLKKNKDTLFV